MPSLFSSVHSTFNFCQHIPERKSHFFQAISKLATKMKLAEPLLSVHELFLQPVAGRSEGGVVQAMYWPNPGIYGQEWQVDEECWEHYAVFSL